MRKEVFFLIILEIQNLIGTHCCDSFCFFFDVSELAIIEKGGNASLLKHTKTKNKKGILSYDENC